MDGNSTFLYVAIAVQLFLVVEQVRSLMDAEDTAGRVHALSTDVVNVLSTMWTAVNGFRLRRIRHSLDRVERSLEINVNGIGGGGGTSDRRWSEVPVYRDRAWVAVTIVTFVYLKYGQLTQPDDDNSGGQHAYGTLMTAVLCTVSVVGNYYVTVMFTDQVLSARRVLYKLNALIMDTLGSVSASYLAGFTVSNARLAYLDICDGCTTATRTFQTQLFINIVGNVFGVTFMMLSAFNTLVSDGPTTIRSTLYFLYDSLIRTLQMYFIIDACHTTVEQASYISLTLQKKINEYQQINFTKRKVQLFILELLDHNIEFIIYGFIYLDFQMFVSIMGTIATYLLILVQLGSAPSILEHTNVTTTVTPN